MADRVLSGYDGDRGVHFAGYWRGDNAADLRARLGLPASAHNAEILTAGWRRWQKEMAQQLAGPFAFALLDEHTSQLIAARDAMGVEPLFIAQTDYDIAIANDPAAARAAAGLVSQPDEATIAGFLRRDLLNDTTTFHKGLERLSRGHTILIDKALNSVKDQFFDLGGVREEEPEGDAVARFRDLFDAEVRRCGANADNVGVQLSGGLDSSTVLASIANMRTNPNRASTLSMVYYDDPKWADRPYLEAMRDAYDLDHHSLPVGTFDPMTDISELLEILDGPCLGFGSASTITMHKMARDLGIGTLFDGHGGDEVVSYGLGRLNELARAGRWREVWRESRGAALLAKKSRWSRFSHYLWHKRSWRALQKLTGPVYRTVMKPKVTHDVHDPSQAPHMASELAHAHPYIAPHPSPFSNPQHTERDIQAYSLLAPLQPHSLETLTLIARHTGVDLAIPFFSRELVEFSFSLPSHWKLRNGQTRYILRETIRSRVPELVANRGDKHHFNDGFIRGVVSSELVRDMARPSATALQGYFDPDWLRETWLKVEQSGSDVSVPEAFALWQAAVLALWLDSDRDACLKAAS